MITKAVVAAICAVALALVAAVPAQSVVTDWSCPGGSIHPQDRCVWNLRRWLHGVGVTNTFLVLVPAADTCVGAKTNSDGTGGNALPFRCEVLAAHQTIWTPGGTSNWGYATVINRHLSQRAHYAAMLANHS